MLELLSNYFYASKDEQSDFGDDELYSYLPGSCTDVLDLPEPGISQSQDNSLTVGEVQLSPGYDRLQCLSNEDFLAPTNSKKTCDTVQLVCEASCLCKNNMKSDVVEAT